MNDFQKYLCDNIGQVVVIRYIANNGDVVEENCVLGNSNGEHINVVIAANNSLITRVLYVPRIISVYSMATEQFVTNPHIDSSTVWKGTSRK